MAGSPIKRARRMGIPIQNMGSRPPMYPLEIRARARSLPPDSELAAIGKAVLLEIASDCSVDPNTRGKAAQVLVSLRTPEAPSEPLPRLSAADLRELEAMAGPELIGEVVSTERGNDVAIEPTIATDEPTKA